MHILAIQRARQSMNTALSSLGKTMTNFFGSGWMEGLDALDGVEPGTPFQGASDSRLLLLLRFHLTLFGTFTIIHISFLRSGTVFNFGMTHIWVTNRFYVQFKMSQKQVLFPFL